MRCDILNHTPLADYDNIINVGSIKEMVLLQEKVQFHNFPALLKFVTVSLCLWHRLLLVKSCRIRENQSRNLVFEPLTHCTRVL